MNKKWYYIGIDGGGTQCRARLYSSDGELISSAKAGPANVRLGSKRVEQSLGEVVDLCLKQSGLNDVTLENTKIGIGLAGVLSEPDIIKYSNYCKIFPHAILNSDSYIACLGAHGGEDGAILVTGTGTSAMLIQQGVAQTICSWGFRVADQASGAQMGLMAIRNSLKAHDGIIKETAFSQFIMKKFNDSPANLVDWSETATPGDYAKFAPLILEASKHGDEIAKTITDKCFADFCEILDMLINKGAKNICLIGGLSSVYTDWLALNYRIHISKPLGDPIDGAIFMAKQLEVNH